MMKKLLCVVAICVVAFVACERQTRPVGGKDSAVLGSPKYSLASNIHAHPGSSEIKDIFPKPAGVLDGKALYQKACVACHQVAGTGVPGAFPPLDGSEYVTGERVDRLASIMIYGLMGPITVNGTEYNSVMAPLGSYSDEELAAIATYVRSAWSNSAGPVGPEVFKEAREKWGQRSMFNITEFDS